MAGEFTGRAARSAGSSGESRGKFHALVVGFVDEVACDRSLHVDIDTVKPARRVPRDRRCMREGCAEAWALVEGDE